MVARWCVDRTRPASPAGLPQSLRHNRPDAAISAYRTRVGRAVARRGRARRHHRRDARPRHARVLDRGRTGAGCVASAHHDGVARRLGRHCGQCGAPHRRRARIPHRRPLEFPCAVPARRRGGAVAPPRRARGHRGGPRPVARAGAALPARDARGRTPSRAPLPHPIHRTHQERARCGVDALRGGATELRG